MYYKLLRRLYNLESQISKPVPKLQDNSFINPSMACQRGKTRDSGHLLRLDRTYDGTMESPW